MSTSTGAASARLAPRRPEVFKSSCAFPPRALPALRACVASATRLQQQQQQRLRSAPLTAASPSLPFLPLLFPPLSVLLLHLAHSSCHPSSLVAAAARRIPWARNFFALFKFSSLASCISLTLSLSCVFSCFLSAFSSFYFLLIIFNFFSVSILALLRVFFSHFFFLSVFTRRAFLGAVRGRHLLLSSVRLFLSWTSPAILACPRPGMARHAAQRDAASSRLGWWSSYIYTCGALIFFCFSFAFLFSHFCLCFLFCRVVSCRFSRCPACFYELCFVFRGSLPSFFSWGFFLLNLRCLRLVNFLARLQTWPAGARQVMGL